MTNPSTVISRVLAVVALGVAAVALIVAIGSATGGDDQSDTPARKAASEKPVKKAKPRPKNYTVQEGDSLSTIADSAGIPVARIQKLNPDLDPQALTIGQTLKLR